jgi:hypothetical protein
MRPIAACALVTNKRTRVSQVTPESPGIPHAVVYGLLRALPGAPGFLATVAREKLAAHELDTSVGVSGPHAFSVRLKRPRLKAPSASTASRPAFATIMIRPFWWDGTDANIAVICILKNRNIFSKGARQGGANHLCHFIQRGSPVDGFIRVDPLAALSLLPEAWLSAAPTGLKNHRSRDIRPAPAFANPSFSTRQNHRHSLPKSLPSKT